MNNQVAEVFDRTVAEGERRLQRSWAELLATGTMGGIDVSVGVFALLAVLTKTGSEVASALAFSIGFIALLLAKSELFTENFLVPVAALVAGRSTVHRLFRLWGGALVMNLIGGWVMTGIAMGAFPGFKHAAVTVATRYVRLGIGWQSFAGALFGGAVITLMTWMEHSSESAVAQLTAAVSAGFLLAVGPLNHAIVVSLEMFAALHAGAPFGYLDWLRDVGWAALGNVVGGLGLVTLLRLVQVGKNEIEQQRSRQGRPPESDQSRVGGTWPASRPAE